MNKQITERLAVSGLGAAALLAGALYVARGITDEKIVLFYADNLRSSLFSGYLTLAGFLFSLKIFIVIKMKENVYDHESYRTLIKELQKLNNKVTRYGPLKNLSDLLFLSVLLSFVTAMCQFSLGLFNNIWAVSICIWAAIFTVIMFFISLFEMQENLRKWFERLENADG